MEDQLDELVCAGVNPLMVPMIADQLTVEDVLETLLVFKKAVYYSRWECLIEAVLNGEDFPGWAATPQWVQAGHNSSGPASDESDGSRPRVKRQRVQEGHNS